MVANDLEIYSKFAHEWWTSGAPRFRSLQNLTPFRLEIIREFFGEFEGKRIVDLGCGGGLLSVPLLDNRADVIGVDMSAASIEAARAAARGRGKFIVGDIRSVSLPAGCADYVLLADVLDHIPTFIDALREASRLLKMGGGLFVGTINRSLLGWFFSIFLGESLGYIPRGTHDFKLFIKPAELIEAAGRCGLRCIRIQGEWPEIFRTLSRRAITLRRSSSQQVAYSALFIKEEA